MSHASSTTGVPIDPLTEATIVSSRLVQEQAPLSAWTAVLGRPCSVSKLMHVSVTGLARLQCSSASSRNRLHHGLVWLQGGCARGHGHGV